MSEEIDKERQKQFEEMYAMEDRSDADVFRGANRRAIIQDNDEEEWDTDEEIEVDIDEEDLEDED